MAAQRAGTDSGFAARLSGYTSRVQAVWDRVTRRPTRTPFGIGAVLGTLPSRARAGWDRIAPHLSRIVRLTAAAVLTYVVVGLIFPGLRDLTGPLTALLVLQASLVQTLSTGVGRVAAVLSGVLIATVLSSITGLTWWSLGIAIAVALAVGYLINLGGNVLEAPISAMLILGVSSPETAAETRVAMTLIGAAIGIGIALLLPTPVMTVGLPEAVRAVATAAAEALRRMAAELPAGATTARFDVWIRGVHRALPLVATADAQITEAEHRRRFNPRAIGSDEAIPVLRAGLASLDRMILAVRQSLMSLQGRYPPDADARPADEGLVGAFAVVLGGIADALDSYGKFIQAQASGREEEASAALREMVEHADETRAMITELRLSAPSDASERLLDPSVFSGLEQVLGELSIDQQKRRLADWQARQAAAGAFRPPQVLDRAWLTLQRAKRAGASTPSEGRGRQPAAGGANPAAKPPTPEPSTAPPTLPITYRDVKTLPGPETPAAGQKLSRPNKGAGTGGRPRREGRPERPET